MSIMADEQYFVACVIISMIMFLFWTVAGFVFYMNHESYIENNRIGVKRWIVLILVGGPLTWICLPIRMLFVKLSDWIKDGAY